MRLIHTSDWHLGQTLHGQDRDHEHQAFLNWLLEQLEQQQADALLIAGDIFDTVNPPLQAQQRLYDFIVAAHQRLPALEVVMIAGNHDSGSRIELPAALLARLNTHARGRVRWLEDAVLDCEHLLLPLHNAQGQVAAWCIALPFLRPAEVTGGALGEHYLPGMTRVHQTLIEAAQIRRQPGQALIAISHAHMAGGAVSADSERNLVIGNAEALPASLFPESLAYVALGHLHRPQQVAGQARIRYSGSPMPLSFAEVDYPHQILCIELDGEQLGSVAALPVPRSVGMQRVGPLPLEQTLATLSALEACSLPREQQPWLEVRVSLDAPQPDLRQQIEQALEGKGYRLVRIASHYPRAQGSPSPEGDALTLPDPATLFSQSWQARYGQPADAEVMADFATLLEAVSLQGETL
ncbi:exonuclease SbcCD subunit D C-terminal domain-containing protein [Pseudomonas sp. NW5]|uniref:exonuclease SbcCD subunit D C-terminal domain-containing protein n=1 Tax=Pseudomonas sp. NW5 TaxID=2934934 RepID=UPI00201FC002|nr:exonuclease SbcCD subunit D C-terminal domain-containing protein [Pseudomonas sp. NW5]MCL7462648.1 exonuclease SbcCD subunit D C-terminal domain-containing protein [Pseudomonas sp. NW5]